MKDAGVRQPLPEPCRTNAFSHLQPGRDLGGELHEACEGLKLVYRSSEVSDRLQSPATAFLDWAADALPHGQYVWHFPLFDLFSCDLTEPSLLDWRNRLAAAVHPDADSKVMQAFLHDLKEARADWPDWR